MNQAILFNDDARYDEESGTLQFTAMSMGMMISCVVKLDGFTQSAAIEHFTQYRFDYEQQAEDLIADEEFTATGQVLLQPCR
ncbi:DUF1488 family protein [Pseudoalteromonas fenneropenaei]|uniref:DUF1488 family protein n=1 Tax=Pseudoalteromonas fenneropenaei TaxID=1737459 RepID=A0ABV7CKP8_9GAMM